MAAPVRDASDFLAVVAKSGLLDEAALAGQFDGDLPSDPSEAADFLVTKGILTGFQAKMLLLGKHKGLILGPYKILDELGRGGMGIVYLAEHQKLQCQRAIKVLPKNSTSDALALDRFYREARAVAALDHPNIVKAYDVADDEGVHYFVMEYVQGVNLQMHLQQKGALPWKTAVGLVAQACKGLQHAHERGLVHRDIKPGNLFVDRKGVLKILDLGLARCFSNDKDNLTGKYANASDEFMGSVDFMAPEVALGDQEIDIRTDIYSLGMTLFALVIGKPPFEGSPAQKLMQHQLKPVPLLHELRPEVPESLSTVLVRMTQKVVVQRYPTPAAVLDSLAPWLGSLGGAAPAGTGQTRLSPAPVPRPTERIDRQANRDTSPIRAEDTQANRPVTEEPEERDDRGHTSRRKRKRFKKKRARGVNPVVWVVIPMALVVLGLGIWGGIKLFDSTPTATPTQVADAGPPAQPGRPGGPPARGGNPAAKSGSNPAMRDRNPPPAESNPPPADSNPPVLENNPPPPPPENNPPPRRAPMRPPMAPPTPPPSGEITGPGGLTGPGAPSSPIPEAPPAGEGLKVAQVAPDIAGEDLDGVEFLLSDYRGKVVLLDFWAFW